MQATTNTTGAATMTTEELKHKSAIVSRRLDRAYAKFNKTYKTNADLAVLEAVEAEADAAWDAYNTAAKADLRRA